MRLIDADAFVKELDDRIDAAIKWGVNAIADHDDEIKTRAEQAVATFCEASLTTRNMPTIDAELVRHGRWERVEPNDHYDFRCICSACKSYWIMTDEKDDFNYCPKCGAKMDEEAEQ